MVVKTGNLAITQQGVRDCPFTSSTYSNQGQPHLLFNMRPKGLNIGNFGVLHNYYTNIQAVSKPLETAGFGANPACFRMVYDEWKHRPAGRWTAAVLMQFPNG